MAGSLPAYQLTDGLSNRDGDKYLFCPLGQNDY